VLCCAVLSAVRKGSGKSSDPMPALMSLPGFDSDVVKKLRKRKINSLAGRWGLRAVPGPLCLLL